MKVSSTQPKPKIAPCYSFEKKFWVRNIPTHWQQGVTWPLCSMKKAHPQRRKPKITPCSRSKKKSTVLKIPPRCGRVIVWPLRMRIKEKIKKQNRSIEQYSK